MDSKKDLAKNNRNKKAKEHGIQKYKVHIGLFITLALFVFVICMQNLDKLKQKDNITEETKEKTTQIKKPLSTLPSNSLEQDFEKINSAIEDVKKKNNLASDEQTSTEFKNNNTTNTSNLSREKIAALKTAESYNKLLYLSKKRLYSQLTSESGEKFPTEAAQYAIDNIKADYKKNALKKARDYANGLNMSDQRIYDQLFSPYGENFTEEEADYAMNNLNSNN